MLLNPFPQPQLIRLQYPVMLMHGFGIVAALGRKGHLHGVAMHLRTCGVWAYAPNVAPYGTVAERADAWRARLDAVLDETGASHAHLIAQSMGGLDARYLVSRLGAHERVKTLTTITAPHRGTSIASIALKQPVLFRKWTARLADAVGRAALEDASANFLKALEELTPEHVCEVFNPSVPDHPDVQYFSYAGHAGKGTNVTMNPFLAVLNRLLHAREGPNDGFVSCSSAPWGTLLGTIYADHTSQIGLHLPPSTPFDAHAFYERVVERLA